MRHCLRKIVYRVIWSLLLVQLNCVDPVEPEFEYFLGLPYIEALAGTTRGSSFVRIAESAREFGVNLNRPVSGASVFFVNVSTGASVALTEIDNTYLPPDGFVAGVGETWELRVVMPGGKEYRSRPETVRSSVPISGLEVTYEPELLFSDEFEGFIPGHRISVDVPDPAGTDNYYFWQYRSFERLVYCRECFGRTVLRNGECIVVSPGSEFDDSGLLNRYTYTCEEPCWQIRYSDKINIFSDEFSDGRLISRLPVADIALFTKRNILVELQQFSLTEEAYRYYKTLKDLIDNNSGFNAPLPAALVGNLFNPDDPEEIVLGRFTAAAASIRSVFIERIFVEEEQLEPIIIAQPEGDETPPPPTFFAPCIDSRFRTSMQPANWPG